MIVQHALGRSQQCFLQVAVMVGRLRGHGRILCEIILTMETSMSTFDLVDVKLEATRCSMFETIFSLCSSLAMVGWAGLILLPGQRWVVEVLARVVIPLIIAAIYLFLMATNYATAPADAGFGTLDAVASLFTVRGAAAGGLDPLPRIRSVRRQLGSERCARERHPSPARGAVSVGHVHGRPDRSRAVFRRSSTRAARCAPARRSRSHECGMDCLEAVMRDRRISATSRNAIRCGCAPRTASHC